MSNAKEAPPWDNSFIVFDEDRCEYIGYDESGSMEVCSSGSKSEVVARLQNYAKTLEQIRQNDI